MRLLKNKIVRGQKGEIGSKKERRGTFLASAVLVAGLAGSAAVLTTNPFENIGEVRTICTTNPHHSCKTHLCIKTEEKETCRPITQEESNQHDKKEDDVAKKRLLLTLTAFLSIGALIRTSSGILSLGVRRVKRVGLR